MTLLRLKPDLALDPARVQSLRWEREEGRSGVLIIHMADGYEHRVLYNPIDKPDAYEIERKIIAAASATS